MTDEQIEQGAIALAFFNQGPNIPKGLTPRGFWKGWNEGSKAHYRAKVRSVLLAVEACDADAGWPADAYDINSAGWIRKA